ncbi:GNAT family N-acyltransferase [Caryophanon tenue]|uniref:N-acetyltransferase domain-containing protein n=1 Tax=Caryophanon tenue TaxID=33978 RepID=A0A1C0Y706_9BACL|nr:GNAT family N-acyltransferase [Caryophanon tenue]OCS82942.1 hypothetical protein A6M13_05955 [Caryophanon tenue]
MYHCKIATTAQEFEEIARLNYETFVEEIPQHPPNHERKLVDKFHEDNTYIVIYKQATLIGMLAFRDKRPFSIDGKIGEVETYLPEHLCTKMCEVRLLAIRAQYRRGRVFLRLAQALYAYVLGQGYSACVISGITTQKGLYRQIGFEQFAERVGTAGAMYIPMVLTNERGQQFYEQFQQKNLIFFPGPVQQMKPLQYTHISHRSATFEELKARVYEKLCTLADAENVALLQGSGTLANDVMLQQLVNQYGQTKGLICVNGEFGERLVKQAQALQLQFDVYEEPLGTPFQKELLQQQLQQAAWCVVVHGETSSGMCNELAPFIEWRQKTGRTLAVDCISTFGALPFSLKGVDIATATSGKALGALAGMNFIFYKQAKPGGARYSDLTQYAERTPFTLPAYLLHNVWTALEAYPQRYTLLEERLQTLLTLPLQWLTAAPYATAVSFYTSANFVRDARLNGFELHADSDYLQRLQMAQMSVIQPQFEADIRAFSEWLHVYPSNPS